MSRDLTLGPNVYYPGVRLLGREALRVTASESHRVYTEAYLTGTLSGCHVARGLSTGSQSILPEAGLPGTEAL